MTRLPVRVAADRVGVTRQTLFKYIRQGKISATVGHDGQKQIDISELLRVFGELQDAPVATGDTGDSRTLSPKKPDTPTTVALQLELERTKSALEFKVAELALMRERVEELKVRELQSAHRERDVLEERNRLIGVIEQQNRLLAAPVPAQKTVTPRKPPAKKSVTAKTSAPTVKVAAKNRVTAKASAPATKVTVKKIAPKTEKSKTSSLSAKKATNNKKR